MSLNSQIDGAFIKKNKNYIQSFKIVIYKSQFFCYNRCRELNIRAILDVLGETLICYFKFEVLELYNLT